MSSLRCLGVEVDSTVETAMDSIVYKINNGLISILYTTAGNIKIFELYREINQW